MRRDKAISSLEPGVYPLSLAIDNSFYVVCVRITGEDMGVLHK